MNPQKYLKKLQILTFTGVLLYVLLYYLASRLLSPIFTEWFTDSLNLVIGVCVVMFSVYVFVSVVFNKFGQQVMIMKHFQDELEQTGNTLRKIQEETEKKNAQLVEFNERIMNFQKIIREMIQTVDLKKILGIILEGICKYLHFDRAVIFLLDEEKKVLRPIQSLGFNSGVLSEKSEVSTGEKTNPLVLTISEKRPQVIKDPGALAKSLPVFGDIAEKNIAGTVMLEAKGKIIGVLLVDNYKSKSPIDENNLRDVITFTNQAGLAIENARLYEIEKKFKAASQK